MHWHWEITVAIVIVVLFMAVIVWITNRSGLRGVNKFWIITVLILAMITVAVLLSTYGNRNIDRSNRMVTACHRAGGHYWSDRNVCVRYIYPKGS